VLIDKSIFLAISVKDSSSLPGSKQSSMSRALSIDRTGDSPPFNASSLCILKDGM